MLLLLVHIPGRLRRVCLFLLPFSHFSYRGYLLDETFSPCRRRGHDYPDAIHFYEDFFYDHSPPVFKSKAKIMLAGVSLFDFSS